MVACWGEVGRGIQSWAFVFSKLLLSLSFLHTVASCVVSAVSDKPVERFRILELKK